MKYLEPTVIKDGGTTIRIFRPDITEEERQKRVNEFERALSNISGCQIKLTKK